MGELEYDPDTSFERDVVCEDEDAFCLSEENLAALKDLLQQVWGGWSPKECPLSPLPQCFVGLRLIFLRPSCRAGELGTKQCARSCVPGSRHSGTGCRCPSRREQLLPPSWQGPEPQPGQL